MIYTVTFNPAVDYIVRTKALTAGAVNRSESEEIYFGGKGINVFAGIIRAWRKVKGTRFRCRLHRRGN